jgi:large subunit ribosomal protein L24
MARIRKGDVVSVLSGKDKGKTGKVITVLPERDRAVVERINLVKHFERRSQQNPQGGVVEREGTIALSKLTLMCPKCRKPARIGWMMTPANDKQRVCGRCKDIL